MKLALIFIAGFIHAYSTHIPYGQPAFNWQHISSAGRSPSYMAVIDVDNSDESVDDGWNGEGWRQNEASNFQPLRQYHHNENVNQFYYPIRHPFISPSKVREPVIRISSRQKNRFRPHVRPPAAQENDLMADNARFFASFPNLFFPSALYSYLSSISTSAYSTTTTYLILNSTLTTTYLTSCIPILSFSASSLANVACRRRRQLMNEAFVTGDDDLDTQDPNYLPVEDERWMGSSLVDSFGRHVNPEILSSKEIELSRNHLAEYVLRQARSARYTITSTFTSYSFYTVNATKTANLGSNLFCMPNGFKTC